MDKPNCYECKYRWDLYNNCHSECINKDAKVVFDEYGKKMGWADWPENFDPVWLVSCDGFVKK